MQGPWTTGARVSGQGRGRAGAAPHRGAPRTRGELGGRQPGRAAPRGPGRPPWCLCGGPGPSCTCWKVPEAGLKTGPARGAHRPGLRSEWGETTAARHPRCRHLRRQSGPLPARSRLARKPGVEGCPRPDGGARGSQGRTSAVCTSVGANWYPGPPQSTHGLRGPASIPSAGAWVPRAQPPRAQPPRVPCTPRDTPQAPGARGAALLNAQALREQSHGPAVPPGRNLRRRGRPAAGAAQGTPHTQLHALPAPPPSGPPVRASGALRGHARVVGVCPRARGPASRPLGAVLTPGSLMCRGCVG